MRQVFKVLTQVTTFMVTMVMALLFGVLLAMYF